MVRNLGSSKVEDELDKNEREWDEAEPEKEEDGLKEEFVEPLRFPKPLKIRKNGSVFWTDFWDPAWPLYYISY